METKTCKNCGRELPIGAFRLNRYGTYFATCNECIHEKQMETRYSHTQMGGVKTLPFPMRPLTARALAMFGV